MSDFTASAVGGANNAAIAQQLSTTAVKIANDAQKQEGQAAIELIQSAVQSSPSPTGNNVDIQV